MIDNKKVILQARNLSYSYTEKQHRLSILDNLNFTVYARDSVAIIGSSGVGKSTLLQVLGGLDYPSSGEVLLCGKPFSTPAKTLVRQQDSLRNYHLGFIYQFHHLLLEFTALENVMIPLLVRKIDKSKAAKCAQTLLDKVGMGQRSQHKPAELSGGERQRVAIARAMVTNPDCILADEPTGNLDNKTAQSMINLLFELQQSEQTALIIVTHDMNVAKHMKKIYCLKNRQLITSSNC